MATVPLSQLVSLPIATSTPQPNWPYGSNSSGSTGTSTGTTGGTTTGGTWTSLPIPVGSGGTVTSAPIPTTSTGNGNITTSTGNAGPTYVTGSLNAGGAIGNLVNTLNTISIQKQTIVKDKIRITIKKADGSQLVLEEQDVVTPQEMVGLSKFFMLMGCVSTVYSSAGPGYNIQINWSELIKTLSIERHFVTPAAGIAVATNVLDITLFDPT